MKPLNILDLNFCHDELPENIFGQGGKRGSWSKSNSSVYSKNKTASYSSPFDYVVGGEVNGAVAGAIAGSVADGSTFAVTFTTTGA